MANVEHGMLAADGHTTDSTACTPLQAVGSVGFTAQLLPGSQCCDLSVTLRPGLSLSPVSLVLQGLVRGPGC